MTRVYKTQAQAEAAKERAVRFVEDVLDDPDRAAEIESESLDEWLSETGRRVEPNPKAKRRNKMANGKKTAAEYAAEIRALREERDALAEENEELSSLLDEIQNLAGGEDDGDDDDDDE